MWWTATPARKRSRPRRWRRGGSARTMSTAARAATPTSAKSAGAASQGESRASGAVSRSSEATGSPTWCTRSEKCAAGLVHGLVGRRPVDPPIDAVPGERRRQRVVDPAAPAGGADRREAFGVSRFDERLAAPVAGLLAKVPAQARAAVVPHHRRRMEADLPAAVQRPPAEVDVVARRPRRRGRSRRPPRARSSRTPCCSRARARRDRPTSGRAPALRASGPPGGRPAGRRRAGDSARRLPRRRGRSVRAPGSTATRAAG